MTAAEKLIHKSQGLDRGLITEAEFGASCLDCLIDESDQDVLPALLTLPELHQRLVIADIVAFSELDYYYSPPDGGSEELQREYQSKARVVCDTILAHFTT